MTSRSKKKKALQAQHPDPGDPIAGTFQAVIDGWSNWESPDPGDPKWIKAVEEATDDFSIFDEISKRRLLSAMRASILEHSVDQKTTEWLEGASYDQLLVAFHEGLKEAGKPPKAVAEQIYPTVSGYEGYAHYVDVVPVRFANSDTPVSMFPVFEIKCAFGIPEAPDRLVMDVRKSQGPGDHNLVDLALRDPNAPSDARVFYVGHMDNSASLKAFERLRRVWGHFFLRLSFDATQVTHLLNGDKPSIVDGFYPASGVYHKDYIVFDNNAKRISDRRESPVIRIPDGAHRLMENLSYLASTSGPRKFVETLAQHAVVFAGSSPSETKKLLKSFFLNPMLNISGAKLPWKLKEEFKFRSKNKKLMLKHFFRIMDDMQEKADTSSDERERKIYTSICASMRKARTYEFTTAAYHRLFRACEEHIMKDTLGMDFASSEEFHMNFGGEDVYDILDLVAEESASVPFPENLPFECCYFGWGPGVDADVYNRKSFDSLASPETIKALGNMTLLGHLVTEGGEVISFFDLYLDGSETVEIAISQDREVAQERWAVGASLVPWMIVTVAGEIMSHAVVEEHNMPSSEARKHARRSKKNGIKKPIPPPYYTVYIRDKMIKQRVRKASTGVGAAQSYRHDVEGHPRLLFQLGKLPIVDKARRSLEKREYTIYEHGTPIPADLQGMMMDRDRELPRRGEWVALRKVFIGPHVSPKNPDLPYVPAVRKTTKGLTSHNYKEEEDG